MATVFGDACFWGKADILKCGGDVS